MTGNGITCEDIDECEYRPCNPNSQCINLMPGYRCGACPPGYTGRQIQGIGIEFARANRQVLIPINLVKINHILDSSEVMFRCQ